MSLCLEMIRCLLPKRLSIQGNIIVIEVFVMYMAHMAGSSLAVSRATIY